MKQASFRWVAASGFVTMLCVMPERTLPADESVSGTFARQLDPGPDVDEVRTLKQNWSDEESNAFYNAPQGSRVLPYRWFLFLEQPDSEQLFREAEHMRRIGYLPRKPGPGNPDGLPIGFIKDANYADGTEALGLTCAACHTTQINFTQDEKTVACLIDGAPTLADFETFQRRLAGALEQTLSDADKFGRFADSVLTTSNPQARVFLRDKLQEVFNERAEYNRRSLPGSGEPHFGPGRVDAFGAILNQVTTEFVGIAGNHRPANAPVSYPFLWDAPQHDRVQWNGAAENNVTANPIVIGVIGTSQIGALGRNAGEVLGVFGHTDISRESGFLGGYVSTLNIASLIEIEKSLETLWSPKWPKEEFGELDYERRSRGETLFRGHCQSCHENHKLRREDEGRRVEAIMRAVGTDDTMARKFATRNAQSGRLAGRREGLSFNPFSRRLETTEMASDLLVHVVQRAIVGPTTQVDTWGDVRPDEIALSVAPQLQIETEETVLVGAVKSFEVSDGTVTVTGDAFDAFRKAAPLERFQLKADAQAAEFINDAGIEFLPEQMQIDKTVDDRRNGLHRITVENATVAYPYKARPLNGIWATAPYLHNGSVPNLWELLKPAAATPHREGRKEKFFVGSREYDAVHVGLKSDAGPFEFDTSLSGNSNTGHEFGTNLTEDQRWDLIEYLKSL